MSSKRIFEHMLFHRVSQKAELWIVACASSVLQTTGNCFLNQVIIIPSNEKVFILCKKHIFNSLLCLRTLKMAP